MDRNFVCLWRRHNCISQVTDISLSALISWFVKSIIGFLNNSNLHAIISTSLIKKIDFAVSEEIYNNVVPHWSAVLLSCNHSVTGLISFFTKKRFKSEINSLCNGLSRFFTIPCKVLIRFLSSMLRIRSLFKVKQSMCLLYWNWQTAYQKSEKSMPQNSLECLTVPSFHISTLMCWVHAWLEFQPKSFERKICLATSDLEEGVMTSSSVVQASQFLRKMAQKEDTSRRSAIFVDWWVFNDVEGGRCGRDLVIWKRSSINANHHHQRSTV